MKTRKPYAIPLAIETKKGSFSAWWLRRERTILYDPEYLFNRQSSRAVKKSLGNNCTGEKMDHDGWYNVFSTIFLSINHLRRHLMRQPMILSVC